MRAFAILAPNVSEKALQLFRQGTEITIASAPTTPTDFKGADAILILGGDGTLHRNLSKLIESKKPVLIVPLGSGNDFARSLEIANTAHALDAWRRFQRDRSNVHELDVGEIQGQSQVGRYFCSAGGVGLDALVARRARTMPAWLRGHGGYILATLTELLRFRPQAIRVYTPGEPMRPVVDSSREDFGPEPELRFSDSAFLVAFANAPIYGHGMKIAPGARMNDGKLDICIIRKMSKLRLLRLFPKVYAGDHLRFPQVEYFRATRLRVESNVPLAVHADGEHVGQTPVELAVLPRALRVITPFAAPTHSTE